MAPIKGMLVDLFTSADGDDPGTDDHIYIGFWGTEGGREFPLDSNIDDFEEGIQARYILGGEPQPNPTLALHPEHSRPGEENDPGRIPIDRESVQYVYIRKGGSRKGDEDDAYAFTFIHVLLYGEPGTGVRSFSLNVGERGLFLGNEFGHMVFLRDEQLVPQVP